HPSALALPSEAYLRHDHHHVDEHDQGTRRIHQKRKYRLRRLRLGNHPTHPPPTPSSKPSSPAPAASSAARAPGAHPHARPTRTGPASRHRKPSSGTTTPPSTRSPTSPA